MQHTVPNYDERLSPISRNLLQHREQLALRNDRSIGWLLFNRLQQIRLPVSKFKQTNFSILKVEGFRVNRILRNWSISRALRPSRKDDKMLWHHRLDHFGLSSQLPSRGQLTVLLCSRYSVITSKRQEARMSKTPKILRQLRYQTVKIMPCSTQTQLQPQAC
jgi:hypothetical protein